MNDVSNDALWDGDSLLFLLSESYFAQRRRRESLTTNYEHVAVCMCGVNLEILIIVQYMCYINVILNLSLLLNAP